ncbi:MAG: trigger factor [Planctomycetia bacterium]|nr:trigger factor [Planctomycetia bacterium]
MADIEKNVEAGAAQDGEKKKLNYEVEIKEVSSCERHIKVTIPEEEIKRYKDDQYAEFGKTAQVPGFRAGKAPRKLVEKKFKKDVEERVKSNLLLDSLTLINDSDDFTPISEPDVNFDALVLSDSGPFIYEYDIEIRPNFELPVWKGLHFKTVVREFTDEDVDKALVSIQERNVSLVDSDEPAKSGDYITAELTFKDGDNVLSKSENEVIRIRPVLTFNDSSINDFDVLMEGAKPGDTISTKVKIAVNTLNPFYAGKEVDAIFNIKKVQKAELPEFNDEFLQKLGGFDNMADLRDAVKDTLTRQHEYEQQRGIRSQITSSLLANANWDLPVKLLQKQANRELRRTIYELQRNGFDEQQIRSHLNAIQQNSLNTTAQALKEHFILEKIAEVEEIQETPEDYDREILLIAAQSGSSPRRVRAQLEKEGEMDILRNQIIEQKVIDLIRGAAEIEEVPYEKSDIKDEEALDLAISPLPEEEKKEESSEEKAE